MLHYIAIHITVSVLRPAGTPRCVAFGLMVGLHSCANAPTRGMQFLSCNEGVWSLSLAMSDLPT